MGVFKTFGFMNGNLSVSGFTLEQVYSWDQQVITGGTKLHQTQTRFRPVFPGSAVPFYFTPNPVSPFLYDLNTLTGSVSGSTFVTDLSLLTYYPPWSTTVGVQIDFYTTTCGNGSQTMTRRDWKMYQNGNLIWSLDEFPINLSLFSCPNYTNARGRGPGVGVTVSNNDIIRIEFKEYFTL